MNITESMNMAEKHDAMRLRSPKSAVRLAYLRMLVEEGTLPAAQEKPVKTVSTLPERNGRETVREKKRRVKWGKGGRW